MKSLRFLFACGAWLALAVSETAAERFESVSVSAQSMISGDTYHGYRELRVNLENHSPKNTHTITLVYPDKTFSGGNAIGRISRTVALAPGTRAMVPLWQPPLPLYGNNQMRVEVDGDVVGTLGVSGGGASHMPRSGGHYGGAVIPATILVSRSLKFDELSRAFQVDNNSFSAAMATGPNDSGTVRGVVPSAWSPNTSTSGPHWLEVDFDPPIPAHRLRVYDTMGLSYSGEIVLTGISGTNYPPVMIGSAPPTSPGSAREFTFPLTSEPIKTARFDLGSTYAGMISIDAVQLEGPAGTGPVWATAARASSKLGFSSHSSSGGSVGGGANQLLRSEGGVAEWSQSWISYTPFDGVAVSGNDLRTMPPAVQSALWQYTECGGTLMVFDETAFPQIWQANRRNAMDGAESIDAGLGRCFIFKPGPEPDRLPADTLKRATDVLAASARHWQGLPDENAANAMFPVVENIRVPVRGMVIIMLAFVIVIGPVNIIYLSRTNRRTWLLWTIPAISLIASLLVFAYSMLREGFTSDVRIEGFTLLDQVNRRASTFGITAFYSPLTPGSGLAFDPNTEATPMVASWDHRGGSMREIDWTHGQHLERGWVTARVPAHFRIRKSETRRERIQIEGVGAQMSAINGLGAGIKTLWLADASGRIYTASNVGAGEKVRLNPAPDAPNVTEVLGARALSQKVVLGQFDEFLTNNPVPYLEPGTYLADLEGNPFLENGLGAKSKSSRIKARSIVFGLLEPNSQP